MERVTVTSQIQVITTRFSLLWLFLANVVGVLLAAMLLYPAINDFISPLSYGRWMPLHMDWHLYGWTSLPLLGMLFSRYWELDSLGVDVVKSVMYLWSVALIVGGAYWLGGQASGKPFLNWVSGGRVVLTAMLFVVWAAVLWGWLRGFTFVRRKETSYLEWLARGFIVIGLFAVPVVLYITSDARVYPPIDPDSGGATGHSLLASTLGIVFLMGILPSLCLRLPILKGRSSKQRVFEFAGVYVFSVIIYLVIDHGSASNHQWSQITGLGSLMIWPYFVYRLWSRYRWSKESKTWIVSFSLWWLFLTIDGWLTFLPGILDTLKFTNGLVAHTHLAMAGMVTSMHMLILIELGKSAHTRSILGNSLYAKTWNYSVLGYVVTMLIQGIREGQNPGVLFAMDGTTQLLYASRLLCGVLMMGVSFLWLFGVFGKGGPQDENTICSTV